MATIRQQLSTKMLVNEGVDHLNLNRFNSVSRLSPLLADDWQSPFTIPYMGSFRSCIGFALWVTSGDETYRGPVPHRDLMYQARNARIDGVEEFRDLILYAKFYQLVSLGYKLIKEASLVEIPWVSYVKHMTGVREYATWSAYPIVVKEFVKHILTNSTSSEYVENSGHFEYNHAAKFPFKEQHPRILHTLVKYMRLSVGEEFISPEELPPISGKVFNVAPKKEKVKADDKVKRDGLLDNTEVTSEDGRDPTGDYGVDGLNEDTAFSSVDPALEPVVTDAAIVGVVDPAFEGVAAEATATA